MNSIDNPAKRKKIAIIGGGVSGLGAAWTLNQHPDRFDFRLYEAQATVGGNAVTADMPQDDGTSVPFDVSVTACVRSIYPNYQQFLERHGIDLVDSTFDYCVEYGGGLYAHDLDTDIRRDLQPEIDRFQKLMRRLQWLGRLNRSASLFLNAINPFNYVSMETVLNLGRYTGDFRNKILRPMFVNFVLVTHVFDLPASLFARYMEFFDIETATKIHTWDGGTRRIYDSMTAEFSDRIYLSRPVRKVHRGAAEVIVEDENGQLETFDEVIFACNANQTLAILDKPTMLEASILSSIRYDSDAHSHAIIHSDASVLPENEAKALDTRGNFIRQYGTQPDNYETTYIMHNQQPSVKRSDKPCLATYNPISEIDPDKIVAERRFQHLVHNVAHFSYLIHLFRFIQGKRRTWHCGAHTLVNSQETCFISGLATAVRLGADYPFEGAEARKWFNFYGRIMHGRRLKKA